MNRRAIFCVAWVALASFNGWYASVLLSEGKFGWAVWSLAWMAWSVFGVLASFYTKAAGK